MKANLVVYQCPAHKDFITLALERSDGTGLRLLGGKCCPNQYGIAIRKWPLSVAACAEIVEEFERVKEEIEAGAHEGEVKP